MNKISWNVVEILIYAKILIGTGRASGETSLVLTNLISHLSIPIPLLFDFSMGDDSP